MAKRKKTVLKNTDFLKITSSRTGQIQRVVSPNDLQVGLDSGGFESSISATGTITAQMGLIGSLTNLTDGRSYLVAGNNVTITSSSNGQVVVSSSPSGLAENLSLGNGLQYDSGTTYNGSAAKTLSPKFVTAGGVNTVSSAGIRIDFGNLNTDTIETEDLIIFGELDNAVSGFPKKCTVADLLALGSAGTLANPITLGDAVYDSNAGAASYNNTAAITLAVTASASTGIGVVSSGIKIDPSTLSSATVAAGDKVIIGDIDDSDNPKYVTAQSIANLASVGTLSNALTAGNGLQLNSGTSFDGSSARTISISAADATVSVGGSGLSVLKVPNHLTSARGIAPFSYDGSTANVSVAVNLAANGGIDFDSDDKLTLNIQNLPTATITNFDYLPIYDYSAGLDGIGKVTYASIKSDVLSEVTVNANNGLTGGGTGSPISMAIDNNVVATISGSTFTGAVNFNSGLSGSLTRLTNGNPYLIAGSNIEITSASNGSITITSTGGGGGGSSTSYFNSPSNGFMVATGSTSFSGGHGSSFATSNVGSDTFFFVSGTIGSANSSNAGAAVFGGDVIISGTMYGTGTIGPAEDGIYTDGLFTDFVSTTPIGTAIDRINEVLLGVAPSAAPSLDDMGCGNSGTTAVLSFGSSQSISGYTNVQPSTLSSPSNTLSDVDINSSYSSTTSNNNIRAAVFNGSTTIEGVLNLDISADGTNYPNYSFGNGNSGTLYLYVNNNSTAIHSVDLSSFGSGNSLNGDGSGFISLGASTTGSFADGSSFTIFEHRTGSFRVSTNTQRNGWNYARVTHVIGSTTNTCNYVSWVNDSDANALSSDTAALDTLSMTGLTTLSGVKYNTAGSAQYRLRVLNAYRNVYSNSSISFNGTNCAVSSQAFPAINHAGGENETKILHLTGSATINANSLLNESITVSTNVPHPLKSNLSSAGSQSIAGILMWAYSNNSTTTAEYFRAENYRIISGSYATQASVTAGANAWDSSKHMSGSNAGHEDGLMFYNQKLYAPRQGAASGDFRNTSDGGSIANGPADNVNYSGITTGTRTFYRYFKNTSGGSQTNFSLTINGSGTIVSEGTSLSTGNISVLVKLPTTSAAQSTGWMDLATAFATGQTSDGDGCLEGSLDSSLNATNTVTFGTVFVENNEYVVIKILADASFTGNVSQISVSWD